jgi:hypothetical protein
LLFNISKLLTPDDFANLEDLAKKITAFEKRYNDAAHPFDWRFDRTDLYGYSIGSLRDPDELAAATTSVRRRRGPADGHVIDQDGTAEFGGSMKVGDDNGYQMGDDRTLEDALGATVFLVVRDHGPANPPGVVDDQVHTFGECNPVCHDLQMSVHPPAS